MFGFLPKKETHVYPSDVIDRIFELTFSYTLIIHELRERKITSVTGLEM